MADNSPIFTNLALKRMRQHGLSEAEVLDAFNHGQVEKVNWGGGKNAVKKYSGYEVGVNYGRRKDGRYVIISVWKRGRR